MNIIINWGW